MTIRTTTHTVSKGECAWNVAQRTLQKKGGKVTTADITKEMQRLAKLNNCDSVEDFNKKFFSKVGSEFVIDKKEVQGQQQRSVPLLAPDTLNPDSTLRQDNTRVSRDTLVQRQNNTTKTEILTPPDLVKDSDRKAPVKSQPKLTAKEQEVLRINSMKDDASRIIEYNKKNYEGEHYAIVDKKKCTLSVYDKDGNVVKSFTVGVGKKVGDQLGSYYLDRAYKTKDAWKAEQGRYTTPGEFTLDEVKSTSAAYTGKDGKPKMMTLRGDNKGVRAGNQAIHMLYKPAYATRKAAIDSPGLEDNRMSYGCVNLTEEDYNTMYQYIGEGDKVYILPEEKGNKLQLEKQKDGTYKFEQQYHKDQQRSVSKEVASRVNYDVKPEKNPAYIAKKREEQQQELLAKEQKKEEFSILDPKTWFNFG